MVIDVGEFARLNIGEACSQGLFTFLMPISDHAARLCGYQFLKSIPVSVSIFITEIFGKYVK